MKRYARPNLIKYLPTITLSKIEVEIGDDFPTYHNSAWIQHNNFSNEYQ